MNNSIIVKLIAQAMNLKEENVAGTLTLLDEGCTIPFISRYRKERTGALDEVQIAAISDEYERLKEIQKRKDTVLKTIADQGKLTTELEQRISQCWDATELEDIYLPFKPRRRTRAQVAREQGLEPLAQLILLQREQSPEQAARRFMENEAISTPADALKGAMDIIAETISEDERARETVTTQPPPSCKDRNYYNSYNYFIQKEPKAEQNYNNYINLCPTYCRVLSCYEKRPEC